MSETIDISLAASTRAEVETAMKRLRSAGLDIEWRRVNPARDGAYVDGKLRLYDTPESAEAKFKAARSVIDRFEHP